MRWSCYQGSMVLNFLLLIPGWTTSTASLLHIVLSNAWNSWDVEIRSCFQSSWSPCLCCSIVDRASSETSPNVQWWRGKWWRRRVVMGTVLPVFSAASRSAHGCTDWCLLVWYYSFVCLFSCCLLLLELQSLNFPSCNVSSYHHAADSC